MGTFIKTFDKKGFVTSIRAEGIEAVPAEDCSGANGCNGGCGSCSGRQKRLRKFILSCESPQSFHTGQPVTFRFYAYHETIGALAVFGLPLLFAMTTLLVWYLVRPEMAESGWALLSSALGLVLGFGVVGIIDRIFSRSYPPVLLSADRSQSSPLPPDEPVHEG
jgi:positive regulator of sigma E activity